MFFSKNSPYACQRTREQTQANAGADASESGGRDERVWEQMRPRLPPDSLTGIGSRRIDLKALEADCNAERMASALESRALKIQRKSSLAVAPSQRKFALRQHNHLLRRQHCSSLCSQSEGHEHVANMTNALGHDFVGFSARAWPPQYSPPHFARKVSYSASPQFFLDFEHPIFTGLEKVQRNEHLFLKIFCDKRNAPLPQSRFMPTFLRQVRLRLGNVKTRFAIALTLH